MKKYPIVLQLTKTEGEQLIECLKMAEGEGVNFDEMHKLREWLEKKVKTL